MPVGPAFYGSTGDQRNPALSPEGESEYPRGPSLHPKGEGGMTSRKLTDTAVHLGGVEATAR